MSGGGEGAVAHCVLRGWWQRGVGSILLLGQGRREAGVWACGRRVPYRLAGQEAPSSGPTKGAPLCPTGRRLTSLCDNGRPRVTPDCCFILLTPSEWSDRVGACPAMGRMQRICSRVCIPDVRDVHDKCVVTTCTPSRASHLVIVCGALSAVRFAALFWTRKQ